MGLQSGEQAPFPAVDNGGLDPPPYGWFKCSVLVLRPWHAIALKTHLESAPAVWPASCRAHWVTLQGGGAVRVHVTLRGSLAGDGQSQHRMMVNLPFGSTVEHLISHLSIESSDVQMALVNGSPVVRSSVLNNGDRVILAGAH